MRRWVSALLIAALVASFVLSWTPASAQAPSFNVYADNSGGNKTLEVETIDSSHWPTVVVTIKNTSPWWIHLNQQFNEGNVALVNRNNVWAVSDYVPSDGEATYTYQFNGTSSSSIGVFGTAGQTPNGDIPAATLDLLFSILDTLAAAAGLPGLSQAVPQLNDAQWLIDGLQQLPSCRDAVVDAIERDAGRFMYDFIECTKAPDELVAIANQFEQSIGKTPAFTLEGAKAALDYYDAYNAGLSLFRKLYSLITGQFAGTVIIHSDVAPAGPPPVQAPPPSPAPSPGPTPRPAPSCTLTPPAQLSPGGVALAQSSPVTLAWSTPCPRSYVELTGGPYGTLTFGGWRYAASIPIGQMWPGTYTWHVKVADSAGAESGWSAPATFTIGNAPAPPPSPAPVDPCAGATGGVTLYDGPNFTGTCHTFPVGTYPVLSGYGLDGNVSSLRDPDGAYHVTLDDQPNNVGTPAYFDRDAPQLSGYWDNRARSLRVERQVITSCNPGANGVVLYRDRQYATGGGCLFATADIADLSTTGFDRGIASLQLVGGYRGAYQVQLYRQPNFQDLCGSYWQDQSDLLACADVALSVRVVPFTPPAPIPVPPGTVYSGNVAPQAYLYPGGAGAAVDGDLTTEWAGPELDLSWPTPATIGRIQVWSSLAQDGFGYVTLAFSDGTAAVNLDMVGQGARCADVTFPAKSVTWVRVIPWGGGPSNGFREVEAWATTGQQYSLNDCPVKLTATPTPATFSPPGSVATPPPPAPPPPGQDLVVSAVAGESSDGQAHGAGNPYLIPLDAQYRNVTVKAGAYASAPTWNGSYGGVVRFTATGTVEIDGVLTVDGIGYRGGPGVVGANLGRQGECYTGLGQTLIGPNEGGGGGGAGPDSGGGGGGYGSPGQNAQNAPDQPVVAGGTTFGDPSLSTLYLGCGGGSSGAQSANFGGPGGPGGGAIAIRADRIVVTGRVSANGADGLSAGAPNDPRGGGGGSGGSIRLVANTLDLGANAVTALGGKGGYGVRSNNGGPAAGGAGGVGRIRAEYVQSLAGTTSPAASAVQVPANPATAVPRAPSFGTGLDGDLAVAGGQTVYTDDVRAALAATAPGGQRSVAVASTAGFAPGQEILIIQMQGAGAGQYEFGTVAGVGSGTLTLAGNLAGTYAVDSASQAQVLRVPNYRDVTVQANGVLTAHAWDGSSGGILAFRASGTLTVAGGGAITVDARGYRGAPVNTSGYGGSQGEGQIGPGAQATTRNGNGGGGGCSLGYGNPAGGGGGGYGAPGTRGNPGNNNNCDTPGSGGDAVGSADLTAQLFPGGGGGSGGGKPNQPAGFGGTGGGVIVIYAADATLAGAVTANGQAGGLGNGNNNASNGGGGAGGAIFLAVGTASATMAPSAAGGPGGTYCCGATQDGGPGGNGRIHVQYCTGFSGASTPAAYLQQVDCVPPTTKAVPGPAPNGAGWINSVAMVTLAADDGASGSGIKATYYAIDDATCAPGALGGCTVYTGPIPLTADGVHTLYFFSVDNAGNSETQRQQVVKVDRTPPGPTAMTLAGAAPDGDGWYTTAPTIALTATDTGSGVSASYFQAVPHGAAAPSTALPGDWVTYSAPFTAPAGDKDWYVFSVDRAGNAEPALSLGEFRVGPRYAISVSATAGGSATALSPGATPGPYATDTVLTLTAAPTPGYIFTGWTIDGAPAGGANPLAVVVDAGHTVVANFLFINPTPTISGLSPIGVGAGAPDLALTVTGTGFVGSSTIQWNGTALPTTFISATQLKATVPAASLAAPGAVDVTVVTPTPGGGTSAPSTFTVTNGVAVTDVAGGTSASPLGLATAVLGAAGQPGSIGVSASGSGTVSVTQFAGNPAGPAAFPWAGPFFATHLAGSNGFGSLLVLDCNLNGGTVAYWWTGADWTAVPAQSFNAATGCITFPVTAASAPSLGQLNGTYFGIATGSSTPTPSPTTWSPWASQGGILTDAPAATGFNGRVYVFAKGSDRALYVKSSADGVTWTSWQDLGGILTAAPAAASANGRLYVFAKGSDNALYVKSSPDGATWTEWRGLGGVLTAPPAAAGVDGVLYVFAKGSDNALYAKRSADGATWSDWQDLGGILTAAPAATGFQHRVYVFAKGSDNALYVKSSTNGTAFTGWQSYGGILTAAPAAAAYTPNGGAETLYTFAKGTDDALYERHTTDGATWTQWQSLGGQLLGPPAAAGANGQLYAFVWWRDNALWERHTQP